MQTETLRETAKLVADLQKPLSVIQGEAEAIQAAYEKLSKAALTKLASIKAYEPGDGALPKPRTRAAGEIVHPCRTSEAITTPKVAPNRTTPS